MKRRIVKWSIFAVLIICIGMLYFFSNEIVRNVIFGFVTGVACVTIANGIADIFFDNYEN